MATLTAYWAGYDHNGNDMRGHMHPDPNGTFIRHDGLMGWYCAAPSANFTCQDPTPKALAWQR